MHFVWHFFLFAANLNF